MYSSDGVKQEITGWRDLALNDRHRTWGFDCPCVDIDFLAIEYDKGIPKALVEYKGENADPQSLQLDHPSLRAISRLATDAGLPAFLVQYARDFSWWRTEPLNEAGYLYVPKRRTVTEQEYVALLYRIRGRVMPAYITERLRRQKSA